MQDTLRGKYFAHKFLLLVGNLTASPPPYPRLSIPKHSTQSMSFSLKVSVRIIMATGETSFEIVGDESPKEVAEVDHATGQVCDFEGNLVQGEQPANVEEYDPSSEQSTETEEAGQPGLSFGSFRQAHHEQMEKRPDTCEKENSELVQSGRDEFHTRNRERRHRVQQLFSEGFTRVSQKPGKWDHTGARPKVSQEIDSYSELMLRAIESSRAKPFSVESQIGQRSDHGSLSFSLPLRDQRSKIDGRDGSGNRVSPSSAGLVTEPLPNSAEGSEVDTPFIGTIQMPGNLEQTCARRKEKIEGRDGSRNQVSASSTGLVSEPLLNSAEGGEIDCVVPSTIQMPALGESQPPMTGLPLATPGIYPSFMARHPTDQSLCGGPAVSNTAAPGNEPEVRSAVLPPINNTSPALGGSQPPTAGLRLATPGIYPSFLARHSTDQFLCGGSAVSSTAAPGNEPEGIIAVLPPNDNSSVSRSPMGQVEESQNLVFDGHQFPTHRNVPTVDDDIGGTAVSNAATSGSETGRRSAALSLTNNTSDLRSQMGQVVDGENLAVDGHQCPMHRNVPTEHDDIVGTAVSNAATPGNVPGRRNAVLPLNGNTSDLRFQMEQVVGDGQNLILEGHQFPMHRNVPTEHDDISE